MDEVKPVACVPTVEHREPCESRGSRTVLGAPGGEIPPGDSTKPAQGAMWTLVRSTPELRTFVGMVDWPLPCHEARLHRPDNHPRREVL